MSTEPRTPGQTASKVWLEKRPDSVLDWLLIIFLSIVFYLSMGHLNVFWGGIRTFLGVLSPFAGGIVIAYVLDPIVRWFSHVVLKDNPKLRWLSILIAYIIAVLLLVLLIALVVGQVLPSLQMLFSNVPLYVGNLQSMLAALQDRFGLDLSNAIRAVGNYSEMMNEISGQIQTVMPQMIAYVQGIVSNVVAMFTAIASSIYMLAEKEKLLRQLHTLAHALLPRAIAGNVLRVCSTANENFTGFFTGKIIDSAIVGVATFVLMSVFGISFAPLIAVVIGITNIIPVFGPFIGAVPSLLILVFVDPLQALEFLIMIVVIQQVDGNFLGPKILGHSIGISALWVLFSIVVGGDLFGVVGMVLGVPVFATLYGVVREIIDWCLARRGIDADGVVLAPKDGHFPAMHLVEEDLSDPPSSTAVQNEPDAPASAPQRAEPLASTPKKERPARPPKKS